MKTYRINPECSLILKSDNKLLCISSTNNVCYYNVEESEKENILTILKTELFKQQNSKIFHELLRNKIIIECDNLLSNRYTEFFSYLECDYNKIKNKKED